MPGTVIGFARQHYCRTVGKVQSSSIATCRISAVKLPMDFGLRTKNAMHEPANDDFSLSMIAGEENRMRYITDELYETLGLRRD